MFLADCLGRCTFVYRWHNCDIKYTEMSFYDSMIVNGEFRNPGMGHTGHRRSRDHKDSLTKVNYMYTNHV